MLLIESDIRGALRRAQTAFPHFARWDYSNEINDSYPGFSLWGEFVLEPDEPIPTIFFVTLDTDREQWRGHLSVGKPCYYWSSADFGDAHLLETSPCATLEGAIAALKRQMTDLFNAFLDPGAEPGAATDRGE